MSEDTQRRLAAIVFADVVSYSRLIGSDESGTLAAFRAHRAEFVDPTVAGHGGRIVKSLGDGLLLEFASVVEATQCAVEIQQGMAARNAEVPDARRIILRIGVNLGDIIIEGEDILGDGVNIAARLQEISEPGGVAISRRVHEDVRDRLDATFEHSGEQTLKNIARPVEVWRWSPAGRGEPATFGAAGASSPVSDKPAIAVLPFLNISADPGQEYFSDGLTEDIITALTHWRSFPVIARNSCFAYKNKAMDITQAGRELGARYVLEGSVQKRGARMRITAQLIDSANGYHLWAERYDRELDDIFEVQDDIVQCIAALVAPELAKAELKRSTNKRAADLDAWDLCLRGVVPVREKTPEGNARAREFFARAAVIRPDYADAHSGLAMSYNQDILIGAAKDRTTTATQAMEAARRAIECDQASSWAHHELSTAYQWLDRFDDALAEARVAVDLNPNDGYALHALGNKSDLAGHPDGISFMERAQKLNPEDVQRHTHLTFLARAYVNAGRFAVAADRARHALRRQPGFVPAHYILAIALGHLGERDRARAELAMCDELSPGFVKSRRNWQPYADPASNERLQEGLSGIEG